LLFIPRYTQNTNSTWSQCRIFEC